MLCVFFLIEFSDKMKPRLMKRMMWPHTLAFIAFLLIQNAVGQSNYASHANNVDYLGKGLPEEATLDGKVSIKIMESQKLSTASHAAISIGYHCRCLRKQNKKKITKKIPSSHSRQIAMRCIHVESSHICASR